MADGSLSQFKATLARKKARDERRHGRVNSGNYNILDSKPEYKFPELSENELEKVKFEIRKKIKKEQLKERILMGVAFVIFVIVILYLI